MKIKKLVAAVVATLGLVGSASAALTPIDNLWVSDVTNKVSDDFNEILIDNDLNGFISVGDVLFSWLVFNTYSPNGPSATGYNEFTLLTAVEVSNIADLGAVTGDSSLCTTGPTFPTGTCAKFTFKAPTATLAGILGSLVPGLNKGGLTLNANSVGIAIEGGVHNATPLNNLAGFVDGIGRMVVDLDATKGDKWTAQGPTSLVTFADPTYHNLALGSINVDLTISDENFVSWSFDPNLTGSGTLRSEQLDPANNPSLWGVAGDASFLLTPHYTPEPGTIALLGLGLLGLGAKRRRKA